MVMHMILKEKSPPSQPSTDQILFVPGEGPEHLAFNAIFALWNERRGTRRMPERKDIAPRDMVAYLPYIQLFEVIEDGKDFRIRILGTDFMKSLGYDATGQCVSELADPVLRARTSAAVCRVVETRGPVRTTGTPMVKANILYSKIEKILLPLGTGDEVTHILCQADRINRLPAAG